MQKKRELLPKLNNAITALAALHVDAAKLEIIDNDQASRRIKKALVDFRENEFAELVACVKQARDDIRSRPKRKKKEIINQ